MISKACVGLLFHVLDSSSDKSTNLSFHFVKSVKMRLNEVGEGSDFKRN